MTSRPKLAVILGAGASYDVCPDPQAIIDPKWKPPLVQTMFDTGAMDEVLASAGSYGGAASIMSSVRRAQAPFEETLRRFVDYLDAQIQMQVDAIPRLLHEFFYRVRERYTRYPVNYSVLVNETRARDIHTAFITVNYDTFLDDALRPYADGPLNTIDSYIPFPAWLLVKLHGSVGWGYPWPGAGDVKDVRYVDPRLAPPERDPASITVGLPLDLHRETLFYPALALPVTGKYGFVCPPSHVQALEHFLPECENFLFIGFSANDQDLLDFLAEKVQSVSRLKIVTAGTDLTDIRARLLKGIPQFRSIASFEPDCEAFTSGFAHFLTYDFERVLAYLSP